MTLGGMALAVGILVDDATVEIENIHRNLHQRKRLVQAILDGASQIAVPAFVSTLCICIVFVPVVFISGAAKYPVHAAGDGGRLRDADQLSAEPHAGADDGALSAGGEVEMYGGELDQDDPHAAHAMHARSHARQHASGGAIEGRRALRALRAAAWRLVLPLSRRSSATLRAGALPPGRRKIGACSAVHALGLWRWSPCDRSLGGCCI